MPVAVVHVRHMGMTVLQLPMFMLMCMRPTDWIARSVLVLMVRIVYVRMGMLQGIVLVFMLFGYARHRGSADPRLREQPIREHRLPLPYARRGSAAQGRPLGNTRIPFEGS